MKQLDKLLCFFEDSVVCLGILSAAVVLFINVVLRYVFNHGWVWAEEMARYSIVWIVFIGSSICVRRRVHLVVDALTIRLSPHRQAIIQCLVCLAGVLFCAFLVFYGYRVCAKLFSTGQRLAGLGIYTGYAYMAIPVGGALMGIRFAQQFVQRLRRLQDPSQGDLSATITEAA